MFPLLGDRINLACILYFSFNIILLPEITADLPGHAFHIQSVKNAAMSCMQKSIFIGIQEYY